MTTDEGEEKGSERTCIATGEKHSPDEMLRFVLSPAGEVTPDLKRKLPGRGVWTLATKAAVAAAVKKNAFSRGFKRPALASKDLPDLVEGLLEADALQSLSLANKAGVLVAGAAKVEAAAEKGDLAVLLTGKDAGAEGERLAERFARKGSATEAGVARLRTFDSTQLSLALGRPFVIHAALISGATAQAFLVRARRLSVYKGEDATANGPKGQEMRADGHELN